MLWRMTENGKRLLKNDIREDMSNKNNRFLLAELGGDTIGFAQGGVESRSDFSPRTVGKISLLYVMVRFRRRGVGRRLVKELCKFYASRKAEHLTVRYIVGNEEAERFWTHLGFEPIILTDATYLKDLDPRLKPARTS